MWLLIAAVAGWGFGNVKLAIVALVIGNIVKS
jgi:hypothetical protein